MDRHGSLARTLDDGADDCLFRLEGEYWTIVYEGDVFRLKDCAGLRHLSQLLWHPRREFHALDLMRVLALTRGTRGGRAPSSATPGIDGSAVAAYRRRIRELHDELDVARAGNDLGRTNRLGEELDAVLHELRQGDPGQLARTDAERARIAVTKTLKAALARLGAAHPSLAEHLDASVKRGYVCVYRPDPRAPIRWAW